MNVTTIARVVAAAALGTLAVVAPAATAQAAPPSNGCPPHYTLHAVSDFDPDVYSVPGSMDDVLGSFGNPPNANDMVCALPLGKPSDYPFYNFLDDSLQQS